MDDQENQQYNITIFFRGTPNEVTYEDIMGYQVGATVVGVMTKDGHTFLYPIDTVEKIIHSLV